MRVFSGNSRTRGNVASTAVSAPVTMKQWVHHHPLDQAMSLWIIECRSPSTTTICPGFSTTSVTDAFACVGFGTIIHQAGERGARSFGLVAGGLNALIEGISDFIPRALPFAVR